MNKKISFREKLIAVKKGSLKMNTTLPSTGTETIMEPNSKWKNWHNWNNFGNRAWRENE
jgi:hypothetical protein